MAVLLFVHGVATRAGDDYDVAAEARRRRFSDAAFAGVPLDVTATYWGGFGADPRWGLTSIPDVRRDYVDLGTAEGAGSSLDAQPASLLLAAARADLAAVVSALSVEELSLLEREGDYAGLEQAERFWLAAARYVCRSPDPGWLADISDDEEFVAELHRQVQPLTKQQDLGVLDPLCRAAGRLGGALSNLVNAPFARIGRERLSPSVAVFLGDVFKYLREGEPRENIRRAVLGDLAAVAAKARDRQEPLVVVGHSMGGIILHDLLSDDVAMKEIEHGQGAPLRIDLLLTVGSQVGIFEELKLFGSSDEDRSGASAPPMHRAARSSRVVRWWNVFDRIDVLSFLAEPVFEGAIDLEVDTIAGVAGAHGAYFTNMVFYERLNRRLREERLVP